MFWLKCLPASDIDEWRLQASQAAWLEKRFFEGMAAAMWGKKKP